MASLLSLHLPKPAPIRSSSTVPLTTATESLQDRFGRKGIKFNDSGVELSVRNGSSLQIRIPDGLITSYKPKVYWKDDGFEEVLFTAGNEESGEAPRGGLGLVLKTSSNGSSWSASEWVVKDADSDSFDAVQVELSCINGDGSLDITYVVSLFPLSMATAVILKNTGKKPVEFSSAMLGHLRFKSRRGCAIHGLRGCSYLPHPPPSSSFGVLSPAEAMEPEPPSFLESLGIGNGDVDEAKDWAVEDDLYTILRGKLSRVYTAPPEERAKRIYNTPPSKYTTIDQGSGLGFRVIRMGYEDIYLSSPGSFSKKYGKDYFICTGSASMLVPVVVNPEEDWRAAQMIEHDNL